MGAGSRHRIAVLAVGGVALAWLGQAWLGRDAGVATMPRAPLQAEAPATAAPAAAAVAPAAAPIDAPLPPGVTQEKWLALQAELRTRPDGAAELARIADYLAWSELLRRFRDGPAAARKTLAPAIDAGLAPRLRAGEVSAAEARQIKSALLDLTLDDPAERAAALQGWVAAEASPAAADPRQAGFERSQAEIVAAWSAQPAPSRNAAALERELDALRRRHFSSTPEGTAR